MAKQVLWHEDAETDARDGIDALEEERVRGADERSGVSLLRPGFLVFLGERNATTLFATFFTTLTPVEMTSLAFELAEALELVVDGTRGRFRARAPVPIVGRVMGLVSSRDY